MAEEIYAKFKLLWRGKVKRCCAVIFIIFNKKQGI